MSENMWGAQAAPPEDLNLRNLKITGQEETAALEPTLSDTSGGEVTIGAGDQAKAEGDKNGDWGEAQPYNYEEYSAAAPVKWDSSARVYEYNGEIGEVGPEYPELELQLFGDPEKRTSHGIDFTKIASIEVVQEGPVRINPIKTFEEANLHPVMLRNVELSGYKIPTPIQKFCIRAVGMGHDVIAIAQTGSGKTAAYLIPILNKLVGKAKKLAAPRPNPVTMDETVHGPIRAEPLVVIVSPSRELAVQIFNECRKFCYRTMLRPCVIYGGGTVSTQAAELAKGCDILVASPGRLIDFIERPRLLTLRRLRYMVIDEADELLHPDWEEDFKKILTGGEQEEDNVKYLLFSATFPKGARDLARTYLAENHVRIRVGRAGSSHENITQQIVYVEPAMKNQALIDLLHSLEPGRTIIFVNSKRAADEVDAFLYNLGLPCTSMHSDRTQREREAAMRAFRAGSCPIMVATAVSARGIDVQHVKYVINYDLPSSDHGGIEEYTHRIGRTGRIGHLGKAISFYSDRDEPLASVLTRTLIETNQEIPDFLKAYVPEGITRENLKFEADSDFDESEAANNPGGGWGAADKNDGEAGNNGGGWGGAAQAEGNAWEAPAASESNATTAGNGWGGAAW
ncbi:hypothetical protein VTK73DRAFT_7353 [Phialemonium thermophilum]|uniref:RNA helicase n=1 Tax=Phialemonium thermophilum TaxID=223376 RepID=A0ABR3WFB0_9PEZI